MVEEDAKTWMPILYDKLAPGKPRDTLQRVWKIWREVGIFSESSWKQMGSCFLTNSGLAKFQAATKDPNILQKDGPLRRQMQQLLDEVQSEVTNELEKVSLERLAEINPDLLQTIKQQAESMMTAGPVGNAPAPAAAAGPEIPVFFVETRSDFTMQRSKDWNKEWDKASLKNMNAADLIKSLEDMVQNIPTSSALYAQHEAVTMAASLAAAGATASCLETAVKSLQEQETASMKETSATAAVSSIYSGVDAKLFTNEGVKKKDLSVIAGLYEVGLPFKSSVDGRRFQSQTELSSHLDYLFKKNQLEKSMERTEERGWFVADDVWTGEVSEADVAAKAALGAVSAMEVSTNPDEADPESFTEPADESQDKCAICDLNFKMFFDNDDGIYKYKNCKEMKVLMDDTAIKESEQMLVHVTCLRALGSPDVLDMDQVLDRHVNR